MIRCARDGPSRSRSICRGSTRRSRGAKSFRRKARLEQLLAEAGALVATLRREVDDDPGAGRRRREAAQRRLDELERERRRRERTNKEQTAKQGEPRASTSDPEARVM